MIKLSFEPEFDYSAAEYRDLYTSAVFPTAFQHPLWLATIYQELVPAFKAEALTITGRNTSDNQLVFVLPLIRKRKYGITIVEIADFGVTDYCAPVIRKGLEAEIGANAQLASELLQKTGRNDIFRIKAVRPEHMQTIANLTGLPHQAAPVCSHELTLCQPFENFRCKTFSKSHRQQIDYAKRRLERLGNVSFRRLTDAREAVMQLWNLNPFVLAGLRKTHWQTQTFSGFTQPLPTKAPRTDLPLLTSWNRMAHSSASVSVSLTLAGIMEY